ncbi:MULTISPECIES: hypothetical protein [unclassified Streptomyces]|uniref:hypothetical protein n=1 Tax=unclassified Streptomyces TaxID=2593676 RepID=UPI003255734C
MSDDLGWGRAGGNGSKGSGGSGGNKGSGGSALRAYEDGVYAGGGSGGAGLREAPCGGLRWMR